MKDNVDIIILTMNKSDRVLSTIDMLSKGTVIPNKIIIMNTLSDIDERSNFVGIDKNINNISIEEHILYKKDFDHGKTRNEASKYCESKYILYMTDDCVPYDDTLVEKLYNGIKEKSDEKVVVSYARQIVRKDAGYVEKKVREFNYPKTSILKNIDTISSLGIKNYFSSNVCCMYDREIFEKLGRFEENISFNEDELYAYKAIKNGYAIYYNADAIVYHSHKYTYIEQYNRNRLIGKSQKDHKEIFENIKSENEGMKLVSFVTGNCIKDFKPIELVSFYIECAFRYKGYRDGKK